MKPTKPNKIERNKYVKKTKYINKNSHRNLKRFIKIKRGMNIKHMHFLNMISFYGNKKIVKQLIKRTDIIRIDVDSPISLPEEELHKTNKKINKRKNWGLSYINEINLNKGIDSDTSVNFTKDIYVSVLDTGIDANHSEFEKRVDVYKSKSFVKLKLWFQLNVQLP